MARGNQRRVVPVVYVAAMFMSVLDTTIVTVALPTIGRELNGSSGELALVSVAYLVALGVVIPFSGWLGDLVGGRRALIGAVALFTTASLLCGLSSSLPELIGFRVLQGVGGAVMTPVGLAMLFRVYPADERVRIASVVTVFVTLGPALGPVLGGLFTSYATWRLTFFVNVPIGLAATLAGALLLESHEQPHPGPLDVPGLLASALGLGSLLYGVSAGPDLGWTSPVVLSCLVAGAVLLAALVVVELRVAHPLIDLRLFADRLFRASTSLYALGSVAYLGTLFLVALFFQDALGLSALQSGLASFPCAIGTMLGAQLVTSGLYRRFGPRRVVIGGLLIMAAATIALACVTRATDLWLVRLVMAVLGVGVSCVFVPSQAAAMTTIAKSRTGRASALFNAGKQIGAAAGVAALASVATALGRPTFPGVEVDLTGFHVGFLVAAGVALLALGVAWTIRDADAAPTMIREPSPGADPASPSAATHRVAPRSS